MKEELTEQETIEIVLKYFSNETFENIMKVLDAVIKKIKVTNEGDYHDRY